MKMLPIWIVLVASSLSLFGSRASELPLDPTSRNKEKTVFDDQNTNEDKNGAALSQPAMGVYDSEVPEAGSGKWPGLNPLPSYSTPTDRVSSLEFSPPSAPALTSPSYTAAVAAIPTNYLYPHSDIIALPAKPTRLSKRAPEMGSSGFYGDAFNSGFGSFDTMRRRLESPVSSGDGQLVLVPAVEASSSSGTDVNRQEKRLRYRPIRHFGRALHRGVNRSFGAFKRHMLDGGGFYGDAFHGGLGGFNTMRKRQPPLSYNKQLLFWLMAPEGATSAQKRTSRMGASAFYGDAFNGGMGTFDTM